MGGDGNQEALAILQEAIKEEPTELQAPTAAARAAAQASTSSTGEQRRRLIGDVMRHRTTVTSVLVTAAVLLAVLGATPAASAATPCPTEVPQQRDAVFEWHRPSQVNTTVTDQRLRDLQCGGFKTVYADISEYVEVAAQRPSRTQQALLLQLKGELKGFVSRATTKYGLGVHAVAGEPTWTDQARRYLGPMTVDLVAAYNNDAPDNEKLQGVQLDIEPYVERSWSRNVTASLQAYLTTIRDIVERYRKVREQPNNKDLQLGVAIPFWYEGALDTPPVLFGSEKKYAAFHLIDMLRAYPQAYLLVMAYRNHATGDDGSIALVSGEFEYARTSGAACGIVIGQEFGLADPYAFKTSFGTVGRAAFQKAASELVTAYGGRPQFRGLSVNDLDSYEATPDYVTA
jgi:hypothetical protein